MSKKDIDLRYYMAIPLFAFTVFSLGILASVKDAYNEELTSEATVTDYACSCSCKELVTIADTSTQLADTCIELLERMRSQLGVD